MEKKRLNLAIALSIIAIALLATAPMAAGAPAFDVQKAIEKLQRTADSIKSDTTDIEDQIDKMTMTGSDSFLLTAADSYQYLPSSSVECKLTLTIYWEGRESVDGTLWFGYGLGAMTSELPSIGVEVPVVIEYPGTPITFEVVTHGTPYILYHGTGIAHVWVSYFIEY